MRFPASAASLLILAVTAVSTVTAPTARAADVPADAPLVRTVGRFDRSDPAGPRAAWSASSIALTVSGGSVSARLSDEGKNLWQVVVDGAPTRVLALKPGAHDYVLAERLPAGAHTVELVKRTEFHLGSSQIVRFTIDDAARLLPTPARDRRVLVIGDSISCGFGNEAPRKEDPFKPETENAWLAYGAVAARAVNADYVCIAWSGKKLWPDNSLLDHYDRVIPELGVPKWNFAAWTPDVVVVNLATNDFGRANPDEAGWVAAYVAFIERLRRDYPKAPIYVAAGTMMSDWPEERKPRTTLLGYLAKVVATANAKVGAPTVRMIDFGVQDEAKNGIGAGWHPSVKTDAVMAAQLAAALKKDLGW